MVTKKPAQSWSGGRLWEAQPARDNMPASRTDVTPWDPGNQPKGFSWFGDAKGKGRWGIDTASDHWSDQDKSNFSSWDKQKTRKGPNLPGWFQGSYNPETGKAYGMNFSGGMGWLSQGGDLTAEHYGQPGSWSFTSHLRPDGSGRHTVGDLYWKGDWNKATKQEGPDFYSKDPNYQTELAEQKARMREKKVADLQAGKGSAVDLYSWDKRYGQEDLAGGKHFTQDIKGEQAAAARAERLAQQTGGIVKQQTNQNKGLTLAERLKSLTSNAALGKPLGLFPEHGRKIQEFEGRFNENRNMIGSILKSSFTGEQNKTTATPRQIEQLANYSDITRDTRPKFDSNSPDGFTDGGPVAASDAWTYKDASGDYQPHTVQTREQFPANVGDFRSGKKTGFWNEGVPELAIRGQGLMQLTADNPYSEQYLQYDDPAYVNMNQSSGLNLLAELGNFSNVAGALGLQGVHGLKNIATGQPWGAGTNFQKGFKPAPRQEGTAELKMKDINAAVLGMENKTGRLYESQMSPSLRMKLGIPNFNESIQAGQVYNNRLQMQSSAKQSQAKGSSWDQYLQRNVMQIPDIARSDPSTYSGGSGTYGHYDIGDGVSRSGQQIQNMRNKRIGSPKTLKLLDAFQLPGV